ncbi:MetQ/NlpA family ABC transporter substrate-binding protein [Azospirillum thermophilum]|uniref:Metal ABC transporter substrate-binding protein n=1 Tax=Azospirillum thermophilum TaxID=2202148 RepID=A0A2S2CVY3_9PROT|nr:metal ABC transporter substrate-binding protein [Azospirillum thermophilum]
MLRIRSLATLLAGAATLAMAFGASAETIKIGVTPGPHAQILEVVKPIAAKDGLDLQVLEFSDYVIPNQALSQGDLDANSFQHQPYLDNQVKDRGYDLVSVAKTVVFPIGIYSKTVKSLDELKPGAKVAIPNDPTNGGRVLLLLQSKGLIKLRPDAGLKASPIDIVENPKKLQVVELDAAQLPRSLDDVTVAAINTNYAIEAGLDPAKDAIAREAAESPYANIIVVRKADQGKPWVAKLVKAYQNDEVKRFIGEKFKNAVVPAW